MFEINNDLKLFGYNHQYVEKNGELKLKYDYSHIIHLVISILLSAGFGFLIGYGLLFFNNLVDGVRKWHYAFKPNPEYKNWVNSLRKRLFYASKFRLQNALIYDLGGALIGFFLRTVVLWCFI